MKKFIRFVFVLILIVASAVVIACLLSPNDITISRSITIAAPAEVTFAQIQHFGNWTTWSPWKERDTSVVYTITGTDGQEGSTLRWQGDEHITGTVQLSNEGVTGTSLKMGIAVMEPYSVLANSTITTTKSGNNSTTTWTITKHVNYPYNAAHLLINFDKYVGGDMELCLANLKKHTESHYIPPPEIPVKEVDFPARLYQGISQTVSWSTIPGFCSDSWKMLRESKSNKLYSTATGIYFTWDTVAKQTYMAAVLPVVDSTRPIKGAAYFPVDSCKAIVATHKGSYATMNVTHAGIMKHLANNHWDHLQVIEEYVVGPQHEDDTTHWITRIYYLLKK